MAHTIGRSNGCVSSACHGLASLLHSSDSPVQLRVAKLLRLGAICARRCQVGRKHLVFAAGSVYAFALWGQATIRRVEQSEDVRIDTVQLANFEFLSGVF